VSVLNVTDLYEQVRREAASAAPVEMRARSTAELIRLRTGRRWVGIYRVRGDDVRNLGWSGPAAPAYPNFPITQGLTGAAILARASVLSNDVGNDPRYLTNQDTTGSELIVPVLDGDHVVGTLDIEDERIGAFTDEDQALFEQVAHALPELFR
jgi:putative methionine-R-sulfoxide reductase with GAF domain